MKNERGGAQMRKKSTLTGFEDLDFEGIDAISLSLTWAGVAMESDGCGPTDTE